MKLMVVFFIGLMVYAAIAQEGGDEFVSGDVGQTVLYGGCQSAIMGKCSRTTKCCSPQVCWIDGKCDKKVPSGFSEDGYEFVALGGKVSEWQRYDSCEDSKGRIGDSCSADSDCCFPLDCEGRQCVGGTGTADVFAALRGYGRA